MAHLLLPGEVRRAFESAISQATTYDHWGNRERVDTEHAWDQFMDTLDAEGFQVAKKPPD